MAMEYDLLSDDTLVELLRADDRWAFREIYRRYFRPLTMTAHSRLRSEEVVEEIIQEVFLSLWEKRSTQGIQHLKAYLFASLRYQIIDFYNSQILTERLTDSTVAKYDFWQNATESDLNFKEISDIFKKVIESLPPKTKQIFKLSRLDHKTTLEISQSLKIPERTIEYHITTALKTLRIQLQDFMPTSIIVFLTFTF
jgi:RNA polymerase sigma-70 factor (family 1)